MYYELNIRYLRSYIFKDRKIISAFALFPWYIKLNFVENNNKQSQQKWAYET